METSFPRRSSSVGVSPEGRREARRVKRTSVEIWRRDCVREKTFSGVNVGMVLMRKQREVMKRIVRARETAGGIGRIDTPWTVGAARSLR